MLYIVIAAARPLSLEELSIAVEVHQDYKRSRRKALAPGEKLNQRKKADIRRMEDSNPSQSHHKLTSLDELKQHLKHPFSNHIRLICGHFLRIRGHKFYLVHQTARKFLLRKISKEDFSTGYYPRDFGWNISRPTAKEMRHIEQHGIPGIFEGEKEDAEPPVWRHSLQYNVANRYLLQVCVDYFGLLENGLVVQQRLARFEALKFMDDQSLAAFLKKKSASEWQLEIKAHPCGVFLDYASRHCVLHYQEVRAEVDGYFDYLCMPRNLIFDLWIKEHPSFPDKNQDHWKGIQTSTRASKRASEEMIDKISLQHALDYFDLNGEANKLWDQENIDGSHCWKTNDDSSASEDAEDKEEPGIIPKNAHTSRMSKVPDRIRAFRIEYQERVAGRQELASNPGRIGSSFLSVGDSLRFSSMARPDSMRMEEASPAVLIQRFQANEA